MGLESIYLDSYHTASALYLLYLMCVLALGLAPALGEQWREVLLWELGSMNFSSFAQGGYFSFLRNCCNL